MVMMPSSEHTHQIDSQSKHADCQELIRVHLRRVNESLNGFEDDEDRDKDEEDAVCESR